MEKFNNQTLKNAVQEWLDNPASSEKKYGHISNWDTSEVTSMEKLFLEAETFNEPLNNWDVSNVKNMNLMFFKASMFNQDWILGCVWCSNDAWNVRAYKMF